MLGPGHTPLSPQPSPNSPLPTTSRGVMVLRSGSATAAPSRLRPRSRTQVYVGRVTAMAPPITKAMAGFHCPATSRKAWMRSGSVMPERIRPKPNSRPANSGSAFWMLWFTSGSAGNVGQDVAHQEYGGEAHTHEDQGRHQRAGRQVAETT